MVGAMSVAQRERAALVETLRSVGPDAPTLCGGWTTRDLTAHLVLREYRLDAAPGITVPALAGYTATVQQQITESTDWDALLAKSAAGPQPRALDDTVIAALRRPIPMFSRIAMARVPARGSLCTPDGETVSTVGR